MNQIKVIKTDQEHAHAIELLSALIDRDPETGTTEADEIDLLALIIENYEKEHFHINPPDPIEAIKFRMEQMELNRRDLIQYIGSSSKVSEVLNGKRPLSLNMIRKLSTGLGITADVLIREPGWKTAVERDINWQAFPLAEMSKHDYFDNFSGSLKELKEYATEWLNKFFASVPNSFNLNPIMLRSGAHSYFNNKEVDAYALWAWQVKVLKQVQLANIKAAYIPDTVNLNFMRTIAQLSWSDTGVSLAVEYLNKHGIYLIVEPHLTKTYLDGAVCQGAANNPIIALTLRYDRLDNFWFTLMHELAHIALHLYKQNDWIFDDMDKSSKNTADEFEQEANALAQDALIPKDIWEQEKPINNTAVESLAKRLNIHPAIIAGRLRHEQQNHKLFGTLYRDKVPPDTFKKL